MATFTTWQKTLRQTAIAGKVIDPRTGLPVVGASVVLKDAPEAYKRWLKLWATGKSEKVERPDATKTAEDGCFRFADLPDGDYLVEITPRDGGRRFGKTTRSFTVTRGADGLIIADIALIEAAPTAIRGTVVTGGGGDGAQSAPVPMPRVEIGETLEFTYGDADGAFYLTDIEPGQRSVWITGSGYLAATATIVVVRGEITEMGSVVLEPSYPIV